MAQRKPGSRLRAQIAEGRAAQTAANPHASPIVALHNANPTHQAIVAPSDGLVLPELTRQQRGQLEREVDKLCSRVLRIEHAWNQQRQQIAKAFESVRPKLRQLLGRPVEPQEVRDLLEQWKDMRQLGPQAMTGAEENTDNN